MDVKKVLRSPEYRESGKRKEGLRNAVSQAVGIKPEKHCFESEENITEGRQMVQIGG